jgi:purine nucleosidase
MTPLPIIIDTDPGIDDAIAILLALASPEFDLRGLTVVSGNVPLEDTLRNTLQVCELAGRPGVPVFAGCDRPLLRKPVRGLFSGREGLGGIVLPPPRMRPQPQHAVDFLISSLAEAARTGGKITLCALGPLTNVAVALAHSPGIADGIERIVLMGGGFKELGNRSISAEFNMLVDPHAASIVYEAGIPITICPRSHPSGPGDAQAIETIRAIANPVALVVADILTIWDRKDIDRFGELGWAAARSPGFRLPAGAAALRRPDGPGGIEHASEPDHGPDGGRTGGQDPAKSPTRRC